MTIERAGLSHKTETASRSSISESVARQAFDAFPANVLSTLLATRDLIVQTAAETEGCGTIIETLKWGQPSYVTEKPKTGTTIRLGTNKATPEVPRLFVHCQSGLIEEFREIYPEALTFEGNRAIILADIEQNADALRHCIALALTHHSRKKA